MLNLLLSGISRHRATPVADDSDIDVYVVWGQSNALGTGQAWGLPSEQRAPLAGTLIYEHFGTKTFKPINPGVNTQAGEGAFGPEVGFALARRSYTSRPFAIVKYAVSGTMLFQDPNSQDWNAASDELAQVARNIFEAAMVELRKTHTPRVRSVFWHQGESDSTAQRTAAYPANMDALIAYMDQNTDLAQARWVACRVFENSPGKSEINAAKAMQAQGQQRAGALAVTRRALPAHEHHRHHPRQLGGAATDGR